MFSFYSSFVVSSFVVIIFSDTAVDACDEFLVRCVRFEQSFDNEIQSRRYVELTKSQSLLPQFPSNHAYFTVGICRGGGSTALPHCFIVESVCYRTNAHSAVQTPGFSPPAPAPAKNTPAPEKNSGSGRKHVKIEI